MTKAVVLQDGVIVAGHPRSGTSLACQLVESAGVDFPTDFEGDEYNEEGYYETRLGKQVSRRLMDKAMTEENTHMMNKVVRRLNDVEGPAGFKIVRVPALFFYRHVAKNLRTVLIFRHPSNVKASLFKRGIGAFSVPWLKNNNALIAARENIPESILVSYRSLVEEPERAEESFGKLGLDVDMDVIDRERRTQVDSRVYATRDERNLYERLRELEGIP